MKYKLGTPVAFDELTFDFNRPRSVSSWCHNVVLGKLWTSLSVALAPVPNVLLQTEVNEN